MNTRSMRIAVLGAAACLFLGGCGADPASPGEDATSTPAPASASTSKNAGAAEPERGDGRGDRSPEAAADDGSADGADDGSGGSGSSGDSTGGGDPGPVLEVPQAPEPSVSSLAELLPPSDSAPLVVAPLPRAAAAQGRLLRSFPAALRPPKAARVVSSSVSPSGDRLQVGLVASTSLSAPQVLLAYRTRLARRGLAEVAAPPALAGSRAAAFRRGDSVVTVTVTPRGSGASYSLHASLRAERG